MTRLDPEDVFQRGLKDWDSLSPHERLVFLLMEFEARMDMAGWDDFFTSPWASGYPELRHGLARAGDGESLAVLDDYEAHLRAHGVLLNPASLASFLSRQDNEYFSHCRDWRADYTDLSPRRWSKVCDYLSSQGLSLAV